MASKLFRILWPFSQLKKYQELSRINNLEKMIEQLPPLEKKMHKIIIKKNVSNDELKKSLDWFKVYCNTSNKRIYCNYSLISFVVTMNHIEKQNFKHWQIRAFNVFGLKLINQGMNQGKLEIVPEDYCNALKIFDENINYDQQIKKISDYQEPQVNQFMVINVVQKISNFIGIQFNKARMSREKIRLIYFLRMYIDKIETLKGLISVIKCCLRVLDKININEKLRFCILAEKIDNKFFEIIENKKHLEKYLEEKQGYDILKYIYRFYKQINYQPKIERLEWYSKKILKYFSLVPDSEFISLTFPILHIIPFKIHIDQRGEVVYWSEKFMTYCLSRIKNTPNILKRFHTYLPSYLEFYFLNYANMIFYRQFLLQYKTQFLGDFCIIKGKFDYPQFQPLMVQVYYNILKNGFKPKNSWSLFLMQSHYYKYISDSNPEFLKSIEAQQIIKYNSSLANEGCILISRALSALGFNYEKQVKICGKMTDFLLEDKIIIESDGDSHFNYTILEPDQKFYSRNMTFILNGYKVIILHFQEVNKYRMDQKKLQDLIKTKIQLVKQPDVVYIY